MMISRLSFYTYYIAALALLSSYQRQHGGGTILVVQAFLPQRAFTNSLLTLKVNIATEFLVEEFERENSSNVQQHNDIIEGATERESANNANNKNMLSRPERKALERAQKQKPSASSGGGGGGNRKKDNDNKNNDNNKKSRRNNKKTSPQRQQQSSKKFELHSQAISSLTLNSTADDVLRAIKRAQNLHDEDDLRTISKFLVEEVDEHFAFGYRGSLLSRLAVAALHMNQHEIARTAIDVRRVEYRKTMLPLESAAIIRGLLRVTNITDALGVLDDELSLPMPVRIICLSFLNRWILFCEEVLCLR